MTFKEKFVNLYNQKGETPTFVCRQIGLSNAAYSCWTDESIPRRATLQRIADYFGVSVDYLLGKTEQKEKSPSVSDEEIKFALFGGGEITDEMWAEVKRYAEFVKQKYGK